MKTLGATPGERREVPSRSRPRARQFTWGVVTATHVGVGNGSKPYGTPGDFDALVSAIVRIHGQSQALAAKAVNTSLTVRNWLIGHRIVAFEQQGKDRAAYGERLLPALAQRLAAAGLKRVDARELRRFRLFYCVYPQIRETLSPEWLASAGAAASPAELATQPDPKRESASPTLIHHLSFSHLAELCDLPDDTQRRFYEAECMRGNWSVRELRRQIDSLYYQRSGLSKDKAQLSALAHAAADTLQPAHVIRDPYVFEFLGLRSRDVMAESDLEDALLDRLQDFLLELGHGFCFEARQKRILIGDEHFFIDLVFYHRKRQNQLTDEHIAKIIKTYQFREEEARYARRVEMAEIEKNDFNLNISRYISTAVGEPEIDLDDTHQALLDIEKAIATAKDTHNGFLKELGLKLLP